jgi:hypothetical protein
MIICPQLKVNLNNIKTLKLELDLELAKLETVFKTFKNNSFLNFKNLDNKAKAEFKKDRIELINKLKNIKKEIEKNISEIKDNIMSPQERILKNLLKKLSPESKAYPEGTVEVGIMTIGEKTKVELIKELEAQAKLNDKDEGKIYIGVAAESMYNRLDFEVLKKPEEINLIRLAVKDLGFTEDATTDQIYQRAEELGLELCLPEVGLYLRLNFAKTFEREQPTGDYPRVAMKKIIDVSRGDPNVFEVHRDSLGQRWLTGRWAEPARGWSPTAEFVFSFRNTR